MQSDREVQRSSADPMPTSPSTSLLKCDKCARTFTRSEHLNRHIRSHTRERPFGCSVCGKKFSRTDILYRHQKAHQPDETEKASRAATGTFRACLECASARAKCSGGNPCQRCSVRSGNCQYPPKKRQKTSAANDVEQVAEVSTQNDHVDYSAQVGATGDMMATEDTVRSHASVSGAPWSERPLSAGIYENLWPQSAANLTASHLNPTRGFRDLAAIVPSNELPRSSWTNGAMQTPADNSIHGQYDSFEDNGNFPMFRSEQQFINREFSSINWLPPSDPTFEDWDFGAASLGGLIPANRDNVLAIPGDIRQSNTLPDIMANFTNHETSYQSPNRGSGNDHISPSEIAPVSISSDNYSNPAENQDRRSGYYVDGAGGRVTASVRLRRNRSKSKDPISQHSGSNSVNHIVSSAPQTEYESEKSHVWITMETYEEILNNSHTASCQTPPWNVLNGLIQLYFDKFHCVFPLLYKRYFGQHRGEWILVLAAAAVGAAYGGTLESRQCSEELHECLRKTLDILDPPLDCGNQMLGIVPWNDQNQENSIMLAQARILNVIGMLHSGNQNLVRLAHSGRSALTTACYNMDLLRPADRIYLNDGLGVEDKQREWLTEQMRIRTGYFIWMVDCMVAYESDFRPQMKLIDAKAPLPCSDVAWEDKELNKAPMWDPKNEPPALCTAVDVLYMEKKILPNVGDLGRILIIHAIYHRTWDVSNYHREKLSSWIPTAKIESIADFPSQAESWLPSIPTVSRWRNIACDAFDILHWSANSVVAGAAGLEHPIILHLHLARLILLTPVTQIQQLGSSILRSSSQQSRTPHTLSLDRKKECEARNEILRWVVQDQYKARLSIIHAAAIFWNTRRYSYDSPVEPFAIYLATLVIWAYSTFVRVSVQRRHLSGNGTTIEAIISEEIQNENATARGPNLPPSPHPPMSASPRPKRSPSPEPSFLHLDRPCDDELVQTFVRLGHKMTGHMVRIGDICGAAAAGRVLREGARRLSGIQQQDSSEEHEGGPDRCVEGRQVTWGLSETFKGCLERLAGIVEE